MSDDNLFIILMPLLRRIRKIWFKRKKTICLVFLTVLFVHLWIRKLFFEELAHFSKLLIVQNRSLEGATYEHLITNNLTNKIILSGHISAGYGNKLYAILSSLVIAILTNSKLYSIWPHIEQFIEIPFHSKTFSEFENFSRIILIENFIYDKIHIPKMASAWVVERDINKIIKQKIPSDYSIYYYDKYDFLLMEICTNPIHYDELKLNNLVKKETIEKAKMLLKSNKQLQSPEIYEGLSQIGFEVGGNLLNKYWIPNYKFNDDFEKYNNIFKENYVVGLQIRTEFLNSDDIEIFTKCAFGIEKNYLNKNTNHKSVKWYVSTDSDILYKKFVSTHREKVIDSNTGPIMHISDDPNGYYRTILDVELLSKVDELIVTGGSTFGFVAAMKAQKMPWVVDFKKELNKKCRVMTFKSPGSRKKNDYIELPPY